MVLSELPVLFLQTGGGTLLTSPFVVRVILPFVLVFTVIFAILQKSAILGKGKRQIDAIVALVIGLIVVSFANATGIIVGLMPFLAVSVVVILIFLLLYSMVFHGEDFKLHSGIKIAIGIIVTIALVIAVLIVTGAWGFIRYEVLSGEGSILGVNVTFAIIIAVAIAVVLWSGGGKKN